MNMESQISKSFNKGKNNNLPNFLLDCPECGKVFDAKDL